MTALDSTSAGLAESSDAVLVSFQKPRRSAIPAAFRVSSAAFDCRKYPVPLSWVANSAGLDCAGHTVKLGVPSPSVGLSNCTRLTTDAPAARAALENE